MKAEKTGTPRPAGKPPVARRGLGDTFSFKALTGANPADTLILDF